MHRHVDKGIFLRYMFSVFIFLEHLFGVSVQYSSVGEVTQNNSLQITFK